MIFVLCYFFFFFQAEDGIRDRNVTGVQTCALPISEDLQRHVREGITIHSHRGTAHECLVLVARRLRESAANRNVRRQFDPSRAGLSSRQPIDVHGGPNDWNVIERVEVHSNVRVWDRYNRSRMYDEVVDIYS